MLSGFLIKFIDCIHKVMNDVIIRVNKMNTAEVAVEFAVRKFGVSALKDKQKEPSRYL